MQDLGIYLENNEIIINYQKVENLKKSTRYIFLALTQQNPNFNLAFFANNGNLYYVESRKIFFIKNGLKIEDYPELRKIGVALKFHSENYELLSKFNSVLENRNKLFKYHSYFDKIPIDITSLPVNFFLKSFDSKTCDFWSLLNRKENNSFEIEKVWIDPEFVENYFNPNLDFETENFSLITCSEKKLQPFMFITKKNNRYGLVMLGKKLHKIFPKETITIDARFKKDFLKALKKMNYSKSLLEMNKEVLTLKKELENRFSEFKEKNQSK